MREQTKDLLFSIAVILIAGAMAMSLMVGVDKKVSKASEKSYDQGLDDGYRAGVELVWRCQRAEAKGWDMLRYNDGECVNALIAGDRY